MYRLYQLDYFDSGRYLLLDRIFFHQYMMYTDHLILGIVRFQGIDMKGLDQHRILMMVYLIQDYLGKLLHSYYYNRMSHQDIYKALHLNLKLYFVHMELGNLMMYYYNQLLLYMLW